jgi:DNA-binding NarL/FixJ family response regulator
MVALRKHLADASADLLVLDVFFPGLEPEADVKQLRRDHPLMAILIVSMLTEKGAIERLLRAGANGFVGKSSEPDSLAKGLNEVMAGDRPVYLPRPGRGRRIASADNPVAALPPRQIQILRLICLGLSNKEIAAELNLSVSTVRHHVSALLQKLKVANRASAASYGVAQGVLASTEHAENG